MISNPSSFGAADVSLERQRTRVVEHRIAVLGARRWAPRVTPCLRILQLNRPVERGGRRDIGVVPAGGCVDTVGASSDSGLRVSAPSEVGAPAYIQDVDTKEKQAQSEAIECGWGHQSSLRP